MCAITGSGLVVFFLVFRSRKSKGKTTDPYKTRANGCEGYVSFVFDEEGGRQAVIMRCQQKHTGHDPLDPKERRKARLATELVQYIGHQVDEVKI